MRVARSGAIYGRTLPNGSTAAPRAIKVALETVERAPFLIEEQKRDILYNKAARFLRLGEEESPVTTAGNEEEIMTLAVDVVLERNRSYANKFTQAGLPGRPPRLRLAVLTCLDCRLHVSKLLSLELGDAHILRNAGGVVTEDVLRSLIVSYHIGGTRELMIINNTKCGMLTFRDEDLSTRLEEETGKVPVVPARFLAFTDLEANVREQIRKVRSHPWLPESLGVRGFIYDVDTGGLAEVSP